MASDDIKSSRIMEARGVLTRHWKGKKASPFDKWLPNRSVGKEASYNAGDTGDLGSIPGSGRSPGGGNGKSLQYSCLENRMDRGAWWARIHRVTMSWI